MNELTLSILRKQRNALFNSNVDVSNDLAGFARDWMIAQGGEFSRLQDICHVTPIGYDHDGLIFLLSKNIRESKEDGWFKERRTSMWIPWEDVL